MQARDWEQCQTWHELFDRLCIRAGFDDNALLASAYVKHAGNNGHDNHDAILKNVRNWRQGRHLPLRRNVVVLAEVLGVNADTDLRDRWFALYRSARGEPAPEETSADADTPPPARPSRPVWRWAVLAASIAVVFASGVYGYRWWQFQQLPLIGYDARVRMHVGESRMIHGDRTECNLPPPTYAEVAHRIPTSRLGVFSDGGIARGMDNACGREIAIRAALYTAQRAGEEEINLFGDFMKLEITDVVVPIE